MNCIICHRPLHESQYANEHTLKSCPRCSMQNGEEHIYWDYPSAYGTSDRRRTVRHSEGPQSYCTPHRGNEGICREGGIRCSEVELD